MASCIKMTFFAPCAGNKTLLPLLTCAKNRHSTIHFHYACNELVDTTIYQRVKISLPPKVGTGALTFSVANYQRSRVSAFLIKAGCQKRDAFYQFCWGYNLNNRDACAACKKVVSDSLGLVDFVIGLVNSVFNLPDGQEWCFLRNWNNRRTVKSILLVKKFLGLVEMTSKLVNASFSLLKWQAVKMIFFAP